ncbi:MAG: hypothetical protein JXR91_14260 [Deltaproteobacteria bacterium]|nr:hypothetical protein [Deltaproteobacteria bacterium]
MLKKIKSILIISCSITLLSGLSHADSGDVEAEHDIGLYSNIFSPGMYGLTIALEKGYKVKNVILTPGARIRSLNTGWLPYLLIGPESKFKWGLGGASGLRIYLKKKTSMLAGFYFGLWAEYFHAAGTRGGVYTWDMGYISPQGEIGCRWRINRFLIGFGISGGALFNIFDKQRYWNGYTMYHETNSLLPIFGLDLELGFTI